MSGTPPGQERPVPFRDLVGTLRFPAPTPERRQRTHEGTWDKLTRSVPKTEADWQTVRRRHDFDSAERIPGTLARLLDPLEQSSLHKIIFMAGCSVDLHGAGDKEPIYSALRQLWRKPELPSSTLDRYLLAVGRLVEVLDKLYVQGLRHRALELILYIPNEMAHLRRYGEHQDRFLQSIPIIKPTLEVQGSMVLYTPFLLHYIRPDLDYHRICKALGTRLFLEEELQQFSSAVRIRRLDPRLPPLPPPITPPLRSIQHFDTFDMAEILRRRVIKAASQLRGFNPAPPGLASEVDLYAYEWSTVHQAVVDGAIRSLDVRCDFSLVFQVRFQHVRRIQELERHQDTHTKVDRVCPFCQNRFVKLSTYLSHSCRAPSDERRKDGRYVRGLERRKRKNGTDEIPGIQDVSLPKESTSVNTAAPPLSNHAAITSGQPPQMPPPPDESPWQNNPSDRWNEWDGTENPEIGGMLSQILLDMGYGL
ncbi:hypothetical protein F66182_2387 [Fusarium sp. NRRL 66182]|nr:hypothetical protein F66182_2387 [Fusarium sp. NRRL 66182]